MAATIIVKNNGGLPVGIEDLGISIPAGSQEEFVGADGLFSLSEVADSKDLAAAVTAGTLVVNDGTSDLSAADGTKHVKVQTELEDEENGSGGSSWAVSATAPSSPSDGDGWYKPADGILYIYDATRGGKWLSAHRLCVEFARKNKSKNVYLDVLDGIGVPDSMYCMLRDATVTGFSVSAEDTDAGADIDMEVRADEVSIGSVALPEGEPTQALVPNANWDLSSGARLQVYVNSNNNKKAEDVVAYVEFAWRAS